MSEILTVTLSAVAESIVGKINSLVSESVDLDERFQETLVRKCNVVREIGVFLNELSGAKDSEGRSVIPHGAWQNLFNSAKGESKVTSVLPFDYMTGRRYMRFADAHPEPISTIDQAIRTVHDAMIACGAIANPERQLQNRTAIAPIGRIVEFTARLLESANKWIGESPVESWQPSEREALARQLEPIVELYRKVTG